MRLICPNCGAQYEVADDVIPESGRDVQCSNCGHTWFESPGASEAAEMAAQNAPEQVLEPVEDTQPEPEPEPQPEPEPEPEPAPAPEPEPAPAPQPREIDPDVADILRQEAEYEQAARQAEADPIETQPEMDLSHDPEPDAQDTYDDGEEDRRSREARDRLARLRGEPEMAAAATGATLAAASTAPRRELLPDIEEINSTLRPDATTTTTPQEEAAVETRSGFRRGFVMMVVIALIALALYVFAPQLSAAVPAAEPTLTAYVTWVDGLRLWLDAQVQGLISGANDA